MYKILYFGASTHSQSINQILSQSAALELKTLLPTLTLRGIDLNDYPCPLYSSDTEEKNGIPESALLFAKLIDEHDLLLISLAEHNGSYTAAFKNLMDWTSRIGGRKTFGDKKVFLLSTSTGARGGASVMEAAKARLPYMGAQIIGTFSLPSFDQNFDIGSKRIKTPYREDLIKALRISITSFNLTY
jgi:NAD(P)H-dependent FMN reductase